MAETSSTELFQSPSSLLGWLPQETLFSLISRQHAFWGYPGAGETACILFGHPHAGTHHDFPNQLDEFVAKTGRVLGQPDELALNRTLLSYYCPFLSRNLTSDCIAMMSGNSVNHLKYRLGLLTSRFRANHPLKACTACIEQDRLDTGWSYWHLEHQYPGVWLCQRHGEALYESTVKSTGVGRFQWSLPDQQYLTRDWLHVAPDTAALSKLAAITLALVRENRAHGWLDGAHVVPVLRQVIHQNDWLTDSGNLRVDKLAPDYLAWCQRLRGPMELSALPNSVTDAGSQIGRLLRPWRTGTHPLRVVVALGWLFEDAESFLEAYDSLHNLRLPSPSFQPTDDTNDSMRISAEELKRKLIPLVRADKSATAAAKELGVAVGTAMAWMAQAGIKVSRRPKIFKSEIQEALSKDLASGMDKAKAALAHGVSVQMVTRFLLTEPGLHQEWQDAVYRRRQKGARAAWEAAVKVDGHLGAKWLRAQDPSNYAWLYRNDRAWLSENSPHALVRGAVSPRVVWDERDLVLSASAEQALEKIRTLQPHQPLRLWRLYQAMPELKPKLSALDKLPLTRRVIERALGRAKTNFPQTLL